MPIGSLVLFAQCVLQLAACLLLDDASDVPSGAASVPVLIQPGFDTDNYYQTPVIFNGQTLPVLVDTGSADLVVASNQCPNNNVSSGCFNVTQRFHIQVRTNTYKAALI